MVHGCNCNHQSGFPVLWKSARLSLACLIVGNRRGLLWCVALADQFADVFCNALLRPAGLQWHSLTLRITVVKALPHPQYRYCVRNSAEAAECCTPANLPHCGHNPNPGTAWQGVYSRFCVYPGEFSGFIAVSSRISPVFCLKSRLLRPAFLPVFGGLPLLDRHRILAQTSPQMPDRRRPAGGCD